MPDAESNLTCPCYAAGAGCFLWAEEAVYSQVPDPLDLGDPCVPGVACFHLHHQAEEAAYSQVPDPLDLGDPCVPGAACFHLHPAEEGVGRPVLEVRWHRCRHGPGKGFSCQEQGLSWYL
jgi:hypothetical protein